MDNAVRSTTTPSSHTNKNSINNNSNITDETCDDSKRAGDDSVAVVTESTYADYSVSDCVRRVLNSRAYDDVTGPCTCKCLTCTDALDQVLHAYITECHLFSDDETFEHLETKHVATVKGRRLFNTFCLALADPRITFIDFSVAVPIVRKYFCKDLVMSVELVAEYYGCDLTGTLAANSLPCC